MILKAVIRQTGSSELVAFSLEAATHGQARCFVRESMPESHIISLKKVGWKLDTHFDFPEVSMRTHIAKHNAERLKRGVTGIPSMMV